MQSVIIGIAGGSGVGKSTVSYALVDKYPEQVALIHLDDYQEGNLAPKMNDMRNWDHPSTVDFKKLCGDLKILQSGKSITIPTRNERTNPDWKQTGRIPYQISPKPILLIEGYLALHDVQLRNLYDISFFLEAPHALRIPRRTKPLTGDYEFKVLQPMHEEFVEPSKQHATHIIDVEKLSKEEVLKKIDDIIFP